MADVTLGYSPVDGDPLDVDGLNGDLYDTTPSVSLYETSNGHIELGNFASGFRVQSWHIQPGETGLSGFAGQVFSADYFQDAWGTGEVYKPVAGCCLTMNVPYDMTLAALFASVFCTTWRQPGPLSGGATSWTDAPDVLVRMFVDGNAILSTTRPLPQTVFYDTPAVYPNVDVRPAEARLARHFNLFVPKVSGAAAPHGALTAGWHSFGLAIYVALNTEGSNVADTSDRKDPRVHGDDDARPNAWYHAMHRVRAYVRNAGYASFL